MRKKIVAGNWKMNKTLNEALNLVNDIKKILSEQPINKNEAISIVAPPYVNLQAVGELIKDTPKIKLAAQNCYNEASGAFTGEISVNMLKEVGCEFVIIGHSERRAYFKEDDAFLAKKIDAVLKNGLIPIFCCGEVIEERQAGIQKQVVKSQLKNALFHLDTNVITKVIIAYEPVWAIGTGLTASPEQAQEMHAYIRKVIENQYSEDTAQLISILYGGSCNAQNAASLFANPDVDGGLIGGASLKAEDFVQIIHAL